MKLKRRTFLLWIAALIPSAALLCLGSPRPAAALPEPPLLETTVFLGEAVPLRLAGERLEEVLGESFSGDGPLECWWVGPQGPGELDKLGKERPATDTDYNLTAVLRDEDGTEARMNFIYRVHVKSGSVKVVASGEDTAAQGPALFKLEGRGLTLYRCAQPAPDSITLEVTFSGLPFGSYLVTAEDAGLSPRQAECLVGVCQENDTVSVQRRTARAVFTVEKDPSGAVWDSYRLGSGR